MSTKALILLCLIAAAYSTEPCAIPTDDEKKCFTEKHIDTISECKSVNFDALHTMRNVSLQLTIPPPSSNSIDPHIIQNIFLHHYISFLCL